MTLEELILGIEGQGYDLTGDVSQLKNWEVISAPVVLIPNEPPVKDECQMIPDVLAWDRFKADGWAAVAGYARIEGGAAVRGATAAVTGAAIHLQFVTRGETE